MGGSGVGWGKKGIRWVGEELNRDGEGGVGCRQGMQRVPAPTLSCPCLHPHRASHELGVVELQPLLSILLAVILHTKEEKGANSGCQKLILHLRKEADVCS